MPPLSRPWLGWLLLAGLVLLVAGVLLPLNPIADGDPAFYGMIARNILTSGDWLSLHHRFMPVIDKPPLTFWIMGLAFATFGTAEWVLHAWHTALALATLGATYALARLALPRPRAALAVLVLLTSVEFFYESLTPRQDIPLTLFITLAVYWHVRWERDGRSGAAIGSWLAAALAVLTKGIIGLVLPALIVGAHLLLDRPPLPRRAPVVAAIGAGAFLLVAAPWFVVGAVREGQPFIDAFFLSGALGIGRFFHPVLASPTALPWWAGFAAYVPLALFATIPWTGWVWPALREAWATRRDRTSIIRLCALWVVVVFGFYSLSLGDKTMRYLLPMFPPLAILLGTVVGDERFNKQAARGSLSLAAVLMSAAVGLRLTRLPGETERYLSYASYATYAPLFVAFLAAFAVALAGCALLGFFGRPTTGIVWLVLATLLGHGLTIVWIARTWDQISPWRPLARAVNQVRAEDAHVLIVARHTDFADFYIARPVEFVSGADLVRAWTRERVLAIVPEAALTALPPPPPGVIGRKQGLVLVSNFPAPAPSPR